MYVFAGGKICVVHPDNNKCAEENAEFYLKLLPIAKDIGVKIATENMWNWDEEKGHASKAACSHHDDFLRHIKAVNDDYFVRIKPHHFLDYLYDLGIDYRHEGEGNPNGNKNAELCQDFIDGKVDKIKFTPFVDDICRPCKKLADGKRCVDFFEPFPMK